MNNEQPSLGVQDLAVMKNIIEIASERGTFKANELSSVGIIYNKLSNFIKATEQQQKELAEAKAEEEAAQNQGEDTDG